MNQIDDEVFALLVGARLIEPTSKVDTIRVLSELGLPAPHRNTLYNCLRRCIERDYRSQDAKACWTHVTAAGSVALVMDDLTILHFEVTDEDELRRVGMSKEHRSIHRSLSVCWFRLRVSGWRSRCSKATGPRRRHWCR